MKIKKFEKYNSEDFGYDYGGHAFVFARYKNGWNNMRGSYFLSFKDDEFVPCMVSGYITKDNYQKLSITIIGDQHTHDIDNFEIIKGSEEDIRNLINFYQNTKKYNI